MVGLALITAVPAVAGCAFPAMAVVALEVSLDAVGTAVASEVELEDEELADSVEFDDEEVSLARILPKGWSRLSPTIPPAFWSTQAPFSVPGIFALTFVSREASMGEGLTKTLPLAFAPELAVGAEKTAAAP